MSDFAFVEYLGRYVGRVEEALDAYTSHDPSIGQREVMEAMRYSLLGGGKRLRAVITLEMCRAMGCEPERAVPAACAIEMIHAYSLIHDDLPCMDDDDMRRGKPSCHKQFGEALAVLAGDGLLTLAFEVLSKRETAERMGADRALACVGVLSSAAGEYGMLGGQVIDVRSEGKTLSAARHADMVAMKTGALFGAAALCGCIAAGASPVQRTLALEYAQKVGLAFQISDDLLDVTGDSAVLGKNTGSDAKAGKATYVTLLGEREAAARVEALLGEALDILKRLCPGNTVLPELTRRLGARRS